MRQNVMEESPAEDKGVQCGQPLLPAEGVPAWPPAHEGGRAGPGLLLGLFLLFALTYVHQGRFNSLTPLSRLDLLEAIVEDGTLDISRYRTNTPDMAVVAGRYYSDKAPGTAALALPAYALGAVAAQAAGLPADSRRARLARSWAACAFSQGLPAAWGAAALWWSLSPWAGPRAALLTVVALFLGGMPLPYATLLFSHTQVIGLTAVAMWAIGAFGSGPDRIAKEEPGVPGAACGAAGEIAGGTRGRIVLAGFCLGLAVASEYTAGLVVVALGLYVVFRRPAGLGWFLLGALPPLLLVPAYSWATVGSPFTLPYSYQASFPQLKKGLYAIEWPDARTACNLLFSPARGLFFWSPFLLMAWFGYAALGRRSLGLFWLMYGVPILQVVVISGRVWDWQAGNTFGPRYLAPMLPLLALPCALGVQRWPRLGIALAVYSIAVTTLATLTDACFDYRFHNPLIERVLPKYLSGEFSCNLGRAAGLSPYTSVALYYALLMGSLRWLWRRLPSDRTFALGDPEHAAGGVPDAADRRTPPNL